MAFAPTIPTALIETEAGQLAAAIVDVLNDGTLSLPAIAERHYLPSIELGSPLDTSVLVASTARTQQRETRGGLKQHTPGTIPNNDSLARYVLIEIGISKKFGSFSDPIAADPIAKICEQTADLFGSIIVPVGSDKKAYPLPEGNTPAVQQSPLYDPKLWKENNQFTGIIKINYRVVDP